MTDRELLEAAAKAAGIEFNGKRSPTGSISLYCAKAGWWNPLEDDGDALRLAVKLRMMIDDIRRGYMGGCVVAVAEGRDMHDRHAEYEVRGPDPYAATRRAIVRAAAAMAKETT